MNDLIDGAKTDVDLAVNDIEEAIKEQREEWRRNVEVFEEQWITAPTRALGPRFRRNATGPDGKPLFFAQNAEVGSRFPEIQSIISEVGDEIEDEISLLKIEARS